MAVIGVPQLRWGEKVLDMSPECMGALRTSLDVIDDREELHRRMASDGYLFLPGYLDREEVQAARTRSLERLAEQGLFAEGYPLDDAVQPRLAPQPHGVAGLQLQTLALVRQA